MKKSEKMQYFLIYPEKSPESARKELHERPSRSYHLHRRHRTNHDAFVSERYMPATIIFWGVGVVFLNTFIISGSPVIRIVSHPLTIELLGGCFLAIIYYRKNSLFEIRILLIAPFLILIAALYGYHYYYNITGQIGPLGWWRILIFGIPAMFFLSWSSWLVLLAIFLLKNHYLSSVSELPDKANCVGRVFRWKAYRMH